MPNGLSEGAEATRWHEPLFQFLQLSTQQKIAVHLPAPCQLDPFEGGTSSGCRTPICCDRNKFSPFPIIVATSF